jgi:hypothetical protein
MTDTDHNEEDEVLKRMLSTPHKKHEPLSASDTKKSRLAKKDGDRSSSSGRGNRQG